MMCEIGKVILRELNDSRIKLDLIGKCLGSGHEGMVYEYGSDRAIKINVLERMEEDDERYESIFSYLLGHKPAGVANLYAYGKVGTIWYLIMERLQPLDIREHGRFQYFCQRYYRDGAKSKSRSRRQEFFREIKGLELLYHSDLDYYNVMKDETGRWKAIDLESFYWK